MHITRHYHRFHYRLYRYATHLCIVLMVAFIATSSIGNLGFWKTLSLTEVPHTQTVLTGLSKHHDNHYVVVTHDTADTVTTTHNTDSADIVDQPSYTISNIKSHIHSVQLVPVADPIAVEPLIHIRIDIRDTRGAWHTGSTLLTSPYHANTQILPQHTYDGVATAVRVVILEAEYTRIGIDHLALNVNVPWHLDITQMAWWALAAILLLAFRPRSTLWRIPISRAGLARKLLFAGTWIAASAIIIMSLSTAWWGAGQQYHMPHSYTYDFNQYANAAQSLLEGHPWLDLPVVSDFAHLANPYDPQARAELLNQGTQPIYWDHAYYKGHWYSYFGVVPTLIFFLPFQAISSIIVPGGLAFPTSVAATISLVLAAVGLIAVIVRLADIYAPSTSLATIILTAFGTIAGSGLWYLSIRSAFYEVALGTGAMFVAWGIWFWLGARRTTCDAQPGDAQPGDTQPAPVSLPHMIAGCMCMAAVLGCRVPMMAACLLWLPLFQLEWRSGLLLRPLFALLLPRAVRLGAWRHDTLRARLQWQSWRADIAIVASVLLVFTPILGYNYWRFGSLTNFGNAYQITVTDMVHRSTPLASLVQMLCYYLFQPISITASYPYVAPAYTPIEPWVYSDTIVGGIVWLSPAVLIPILGLSGALIMLLRRAYTRLKHSIRRTHGITSTNECSSEFAPTKTDLKSQIISSRSPRTRVVGDSPIPLIVSLVALGGFVFVVVTAMAGLDWRYITDFAWYWLLAATLLTFLAQPTNNQYAHTAPYETMLLETKQSDSYRVQHNWQRIMRKILFICCIICFCWTIVSNLLQPFANHQAMSLMKYNLDAYLTPYAWTLWI